MKIFEHTLSKLNYDKKSNHLRIGRLVDCYFAAYKEVAWDIVLHNDWKHRVTTWPYLIDVLAHLVTINISKQFLLDEE